MKFINLRYCLCTLFYIFTVTITGCNEGSSTTTALQSKYTKIDNQELHYFQINNTQENPIILLTGVGTTGSFWNKNFISCLAQHHQVYILDYPGIKSKLANGSTISVNYFAQILNRFVQQQQLSKATLVGWSMGGSVALQASFLDNNLYQHLYLLAAYIPTGENISNPFPKHPPFTNTNAIFNYVFANNLYNYTPTQLNIYKEQLLSTKVHEIFPSLEYTKAQIASTQLWGNDTANVNTFENATIPATFIIPDNDTIIQESMALTEINHYGGPKNILHIPNSGHDVSLQEPDTICNYINNSN